MPEVFNIELPESLQRPELFLRVVGKGRNELIESMGGYEILSHLSPNGKLDLNVESVADDEYQMDTMP